MPITRFPALRAHFRTSFGPGDLPEHVDIDAARRFGRCSKLPKALVSIDIEKLPR